ncbi:MAG: hypothetical protein CMN64_14470 [Sphingobium sp.]|nr:hypothetical protein [Sphingobium sp.]
MRLVRIRQKVTSESDIQFEAIEHFCDLRWLQSKSCGSYESRNFIVNFAKSTTYTYTHSPDKAHKSIFNGIKT